MKKTIVSILVILLPRISLFAFEIIQTPSIKLISTIDGKSSGMSNTQLVIPTDVAMIDNQIVVVDAGEHKLKFYEADGTFKKQVGRKGSNPGEFYFPYSIDVSTNGRIYVSDLANNRIQSFDQDGRYQGNLAFTTGNLRISNSNFISVTKPHGYFNYAIDGSSTFSDSSNIHFFTFGGEIKSSFSKSLNYNNQQMDIKGNEVYIEIDDLGSTIVTYAYRNLIEKYDLDGTLLWSANRPLNYEVAIPISKEGKSSGFNEVQMNKCYAGISVDDSRRIWAVRLNRQLYTNERVGTDLNMMRGVDGQRNISMKVSDFEEPSSTDAFVIDIFNAKGDFISSIPLSHYVDNIRIYQNRLFIIDTYHTQTVFQYEILD